MHLCVFFLCVCGFEISNFYNSVKNKSSWSVRIKPSEKNLAYFNDFFYVFAELNKIINENTTELYIIESKSLSLFLLLDPFSEMDTISASK